KLGEAGLVALAVRHRAGGRRDAPGRLDAHVAALPARRARLDEGRETDAHQRPFAARPLLALLLTQRRQVDALQQQVERALVVARVVGDAGRRGVGELVGGDEVAAAQLDRVDLQLARQHVYQALDAVGRLRASGAAVRPRRRRVGEGGDQLGVVGADL